MPLSFMTTPSRQGILLEGLTIFDYEEIRWATSDFSQDKVLGRGAHSCVYRGRMRFGKLIVVKKMDCDDKESDKAFCRELHIASNLKNHHVVPLLGYFIDCLGLFLVYKFISGGSLKYNLHGIVISVVIILFGILLCWTEKKKSKS